MSSPRDSFSGDGSDEEDPPSPGMGREAEEGPETIEEVSEHDLSEEDYYEETPEEGAEMVMLIMKPVTITMVILISLVKLLTIPSLGLSPGQVLLYQESSNRDDEGQQIAGALLTGAIVLVSVLAATSFFIVLYKYRCLKLIYTWLMCSSGGLLAMFGSGLLYLSVDTLQVAMDWFFFAFVIWNFAVTGVVAIFWYAPPMLQQAYLVAVSVLIAGGLTQLPEWTTWVVLAIIAIYDVFAVLCPKGPLKVLLDTAQERGETIPALLYTASAWITMARIDGRPGTGANAAAAGDRRAVALQELHLSDDDGDGGDVQDDNVRGGLMQGHASGDDEGGFNSDFDEDSATGVLASPGPDAGPPRVSVDGIPPPEERNGLQLGLGDFVFYSVLVGRAALFEMMTVYTCFVAIVTGLLATLLLLSIFRRALPALPFSIGLGIAFYFLTRLFLLPMVEFMHISWGILV